MKNKIWVFIFGFSSICLLPIMQAHNFYNDSMEIEPMLRLAVVGLSHDHVHGILRKAQQGKVQIVGIVEKDQALVDRLQARYGFAYDLVYHDLDNMLSATKPDAVTAFNMISQHVDVVEKCAPLGIHVMVEKPLAATLQQARRMEKLAKQHGIHLLTNYETTWYASNTAAQEIISSNGLGTLRKIIFKTGHKGPREIGCSEEFLSWLTDPVLNGGGALTDFGCYGANLTTWLLQGQTPNKVFCTTQQLKPDIYPKVDDEATIVLTYPSCQVIIQASWNWTFGRKDMEIYGNEGYLICKDGSSMVVQEKGKQKASPRTAPKISGASKDPFEFFRKVINVNDAVKPFSPSSLENNLIVIQILEAAKESAQTGKSIHFDDFVRTH